jgi:hypothetical protein
MTWTRQIGARKQLFVDDYMVAETVHLSRTFHAAQKHPGNPILRGENPWEFPFSASISCPKVIYDTGLSQYRMWYETFLFGKREYVCYATSQDGLEWECPNLGLVEFEGSRQNNIVSIEGTDFPQIPRALLYCPEMQGIEPEARLYKALQWLGDGGVGVYFSPDGLRWTAYEHNPVITGVGDTAKVCKFAPNYPMLDYNREIFGDNPPRYLAFPKVSAKLAGKGRRSVGFSACEVPIGYGANQQQSFTTWTPPVLVLAPDYIDDAMGVERTAQAQAEGAVKFDHPEDHFTDFYGMEVLPYDGLYIGLLEVFDHTYDMRRVGAWNQHGIFEMQLTASRDLLHWQRVGDRQPLIPRGPGGAWDNCMILMASAVVTDEEIRFYYQGTSLAHSDRLGFDRVWTDEQARKTAAGERYPFSCVGLATLRLDGFVSLDAADQPGMLLTPPLRFQARELTINAAATGGAVAVEILTESGQPIEGFRRDDCDLFSGDSVRAVVRWRGNADVSRLRGEPLRLRFHLNHAQLYAFQFV